MSKVIVLRYTGSEIRRQFSVVLDADHFQISVKALGANWDRVVFNGECFSSEEYEKRGGKAEENKFIASCSE